MSEHSTTAGSLQSQLTNSITAVSVVYRSIQSILNSPLTMLLKGPHRELIGKTPLELLEESSPGAAKES